MSFKLQQQPVVNPKPKTSAQLQLDIETVANVPITGRTNIDIIADLRSAIQQIIKLYGVEFEHANDCIHQLRLQAQVDADALEELRKVIVQQKLANDELFKIKQKVVIVNREIMQRNARLEKQVDAAKAYCDAHRDDYETMKTSDSMDVDAEFMLLFQAVMPDAPQHVLD